MLRHLSSSYKYPLMSFYVHISLVPELMQGIVLTVSVCRSYVACFQSEFPHLGLIPVMFCFRSLLLLLFNNCRATRNYSQPENSSRFSRITSPTKYLIVRRKLYKCESQLKPARKLKGGKFRSCAKDKSAKLTFNSLGKKN